MFVVRKLVELTSAPVRHRQILPLSLPLLPQRIVATYMPERTLTSLCFLLMPWMVLDAFGLEISLKTNDSDGKAIVSNRNWLLFAAPSKNSQVWHIQNYKVATGIASTFIENRLATEHLSRERAAAPAPLRASTIVITNTVDHCRYLTA